jgi:hypothetical protein
MSVKHKIKVYLYNNVLTDNPNDFIARVHSERSLNVKDICQTATARGGAEISAEAMEHAVNLWLKEMSYQLCNGFSINTGWFLANVSVKGVFHSPDEHFDPHKQTLVFDFHQGDKLRREIQETEVQVLGLADTGGRITQVLDMRTGSINDLLTPDRNLKISGHKIKIAGDHPDNGVFLLDESGNEIRIEPADIVMNHPSELMIIIPSLPSGGYRLMVRTQFSGSANPLKEPRSVSFDKTLHIP